MLRQIRNTLCMHKLEEQSYSLSFTTLSLEEIIVKDLKSALKKIGNDELKVEILSDQLEWIKRGLKEHVKSMSVTFALMLGGIFTLLYDKELKDIALVLFTLGVARIFYKR